MARGNLSEGHTSALKKLCSSLSDEMLGHWVIGFSLRRP